MSVLDDDPALTLLSEDLKELGSLRVAPAPRERTLALLRAEVRRQDARGAFKPAPRRTFSRLAYAAAALLVATGVGLFALTGGPDEGSEVANNPTTSDTHVVGTTTDTQSPDTTGSSLPATVTTHTTQAPVTTEPATTPSTDHVVTTDDEPAPTTPPTSTRPRTTTTVPPGTTTTTGSAVMTWEEREDSARTVVLSVADKIMTGSLAGVDTYVASSAKGGLAHLIASLERPSAARILSVKETTTGVRVLLEVTDNLSDGQGDLQEVPRRFYFETRTDNNGALITAIYAGPAR